MDQIKHETNNEIIFEKAVTEIFKRISETVSEEEFRKILTIPSTINSKSKKFSKIFSDELNRSMNGTLEDIKSKEGCLTEGFVKLSNTAEGIISPINYAWRPPGDVKLHLRSHNLEKVVDECAMLEKQISEIQMQNEEKMRKLAESQREIDSLQEKTTYWLNRSKSDVPHMQEIIDTLEKSISSIDELQ